MNPNSIGAVCLTHIGKRENHEDNFLLAGQFLTSNLQQEMSRQEVLTCVATPTKAVQIFAISDGMGGHNGGEVASLICVKFLKELENKLQNLTNYRQIGDLVQYTIKKINSKILDVSRKNPELNNMGATLILLVRYNANYLFFNLGDSRAYYFNGSNLYQISKDHTEGQRMLDLGLLNKNELKDFPARKSVNRYLGFDRPGMELEAEEIFVKVRKGYIILCSDGISDNVSINEMNRILLKQDNIVKAGKAIIREAVKGARADNATILILKV